MGESGYTDDQLLTMAMANIGEYIHDNSPHYIVIQEDPRNDEDFDTWDYGTEPLPHDLTWCSTSAKLDEDLQADITPKDPDLAEQ